MHRTFSIVLLVLPVLAFAPACGGALSSSVDGKGDAGSGSDGAGSGSGAAASSGGSGGSGGSSGSSGSSGSGGSGSGSSGAFSDSGSAGSDAAGAPPDAASGLDAAGSADTAPTGDSSASGPFVLCPSNGSADTCAPGQSCCVVGDAKQGGTQTDTCVSSGTPCAGTLVECARAADCPSGQVCCGTQQTVGGVVSYAGVVCAMTCAGQSQARVLRSAGEHLRAVDADVRAQHDHAGVRRLSVGARRSPSPEKANPRHLVKRCRGSVLLRATAS